MLRRFWPCFLTISLWLMLYTAPAFIYPVYAQSPASLKNVAATNINQNSPSTSICIMPRSADVEDACAEEADGEDLFGIMPASTPRQESGSLVWDIVDSQNGLALIQLPVPAVPDTQNYITVVRIDPALYDFSLHSISAEGAPAKTLAEWADIHKLNVAVNASMYLPDASTSTGYMRNGTQLNNPRIVNKFGAFFVAGPRASGLPPAAILDRTVDDWEKLIPQYEIVVQNYRLINAQKNILWPAGGPMYSIAAIAQDADNNILFIHSKPITAQKFTQALLDLPLNIIRIMYVEGGPQAALLLNTDTVRTVWIGHYAGDYFLNSPQAPLPNIIGARKKQP